MFEFNHSRPQETFFFPDEDYPFIQPDRPRQVPVSTGTLPPTPAQPTNAPNDVSTVGGVTTTRPTPTTGSPAYIQCLSNCPTTSEYNPVCGTDLVTYNNRQRLDCANFCGPRVNQQWSGECLNTFKNQNTINIYICFSF